MRLIIDCNFLCYQSFHSLTGLSYNEKKVNVIYGFLRRILKLSEQFKTADFIFCWDSKQSYRKLIYSEYKAKRRTELTDEQREDMDLGFEQFDLLREKILPYMGFSNVFHQTGYEADDLIAYVTARFPEDTVIVSADKDLYQLLINHRFCPVKIWNFKVMNDENRFRSDWFGLKPTDWIEVKSIAGCSSDNIAGIVGVGEITAAKYIAKQLKSKNMIDKIKESKCLVDFNRRLVALPFYGRKPIKIQGIVEDEITFDKFFLTFGQYGFRSLLADSEVKKWSKSFFGV